MKEKLPDSEKFQYKFKNRVQQNYHLKKGKKAPTIRSQSNFHDKLKESLQKKFCKYNGSPCIRQFIPAEGFYSMRRILSFEKMKLKEAVSPAFKREIKKAQAEGKNYYFSLAYLDLSQGNQCMVFRDCNSNFMDFMGFEIKREDDYADFKAYRSAAEIFISTKFDKFAHEFSKRRSIKSKYGIYDLENFIIF
ncbi:MAG: hypothetical protein PVH61_39765 [Candidatus Aminicenantes bacterium]